MQVSRVFIERPVATILSMLALLLSGILAWQLLPVSSLPEVDYPTIQVSTFYPGANAETMTALVTSPLERQLGANAWVKANVIQQRGGGINDYPTVCA